MTLSILSDSIGPFVVLIKLKFNDTSIPNQKSIHLLDNLIKYKRMQDGN